jgi:hypothetical protein
MTVEIEQDGPVTMIQETIVEDEESKVVENN